MLLKGKVHLFGDNIDTDLIIAAEYLNSENPEVLKQYCFLAADPEFPFKVKAGDMVFGGNNFGCGSSREHAPLALKGCGISLIVAKSFARIFYRNCINIGLPIMVCAEAVDAVKDQDEAEVDLTKGEIQVGGRLIKAQEFPPFMQDLIKAGGLMEYITAK